jgi:DNA polymerase-3 subunit delta
MIFFFYGPNSYARRQQVGQMIVQYTKKTGSDIGLERIDGSTVKLDTLRADIMAVPFLTTSRFVIVEGVSTNKSVTLKLPELIAMAPTSTVVVFVEREIDQRTLVFKELKKADKVMKFDQLARPQLMNWLKREVESQKATIDSSAINALLEACGDDQWRLSQEINKLANFDPVISVKAIREMVTPSVEQSIFELVESMTAGRGDVAITGYHRLLRMKESELGVLAMIQWQLRNLLLAKTAMAMSSSELAKATGMSPYVAGKMQTAQRRLTQDRLLVAFKQAADCEYDIKSGRIKGEIAVEQLIFRVALLSRPKS